MSKEADTQPATGDVRPWEITDWTDEMDAAAAEARAEVQAQDAAHLKTADADDSEESEDGASE